MNKKKSLLKTFFEVVLILLFVGVLYVEFYVYSFCFVEGVSMNPTIRDKDTLILKLDSDITYNDIVSIDSEKLDKLLCKRVIGLEGDTIEIKYGIVYRNGDALAEPYNEDKETTIDKVTVGKGQVYVLGDNRLNSNDSRQIGCLDSKDIKGKVIKNLGKTWLNADNYASIRVLIIFFCLVLVVFDIKSRNLDKSIDKSKE